MQLSNEAARRMVAGVAEEVRGVPTNVFRAALHPEGLAAGTKDFAAWSTYLLRQLQLLSRHEEAMETLATEIATWERIPDRSRWGRLELSDLPEPVQTWQIRVGEHDLNLFTIMSRLGTATDVTLSDLTIELFFPADDATERQLRSAADKTDRGY